MNFVDCPLEFDCEGDELIGMLSIPEIPAEVGVVVVVGGPQYRAGSHRQFVYLSRMLASKGIACLRFDYRGMGDSEGLARPFDATQADVAAAVAALRSHVPQVTQVVLWGLCDGASAALMSLPALPDVTAVIALNPWLRSETSRDSALVKHYYLQRLVSRAFWAKVSAGDFRLIAAWAEFIRRVVAALTARLRSGRRGEVGLQGQPPYQERMLAGLSQSPRRFLFILSGRDLTAQEFLAYTATDARWKSALSRERRVLVRLLEGADHTFSGAHWREEVERLSCEFVLEVRSESRSIAGADARDHEADVRGRPKPYAARSPQHDAAGVQPPRQPRRLP